MPSTPETSTTYSKIRFIGYAIPTTPANVISIGNPNGPGAVAGSYLANDDMATDMAKRVAIMANAVVTAKNTLPADESGVINVFVVPEFYFHGSVGPYVYSDEDADPIDSLMELLAKTFPADDYPNWTFICGSAITSLIKNVDKVFQSSSAQVRNSVVENLSKQWLASFGPLNGVIFDMLIDFIKNCHAYPNCQVRNRSVILSHVPIRTPEVDAPTTLMSTEKYYCSNEDFLLYEVNGKPVITEQMTAYPPLDLSAGDAKQSAFDPYAIFRQNRIDPDNPLQTEVMDYGVEICLDHSDVRLRRNLDNEPQVIGGIHVQLIPSCGMQINPLSVAADSHGFVFNCDGQYALDERTSGQAVFDDVDCLFANYSVTESEQTSNTTYAAHSQLARVEKPAIGGDPNASGAKNATFLTLNAEDITVIPVEAPANLELDGYYAGGPGQLHIYGLAEPYILYPGR